MTDVEIRLELAKVALANGLNTETAKVFYDWVVNIDDKMRLLEATPICEVAAKTSIPNTVNTRCRENNILSVGALVEFGRTNFSKCRNVGKFTVHQLDEALKSFGVENW